MEVSADFRGLRAGLIAAAALLLALSAIAATARADTIAYSCAADICLINPDNPSEHSNLTETDPVAAQERSPSWAPGGNWIAYVANSPGKLYDVWVLDPTKSADEGVTTNISDNDETNANFETPPVWSPDGTRVAYFEEWWGGGKTNDVFVSPFDGSANQVPIGSTNDGETSPSWTPDGRVVFGRNVAAYIGNADGSGTPTVVANSSGYQPSISPDGKFIAMENAGPYPFEVRIVNADGSGFHLLSKPGDLGSVFDWSADSTRLAYVSDEEPNPDQVRVAPADGSSPGNVVPMPAGYVSPHNPSFSPDGTRVAFNASNGSYQQILVGPADGSAPAVAITQGAMENQEPDWKPGPGGPKPPSGNPGGSAPGGGAGGGSSQPTKTPVKIRLAYLKAPIITPRYMTPVSIDCHAQGGHPTGWVAEFCAATASAYPQGASTGARFRPWWAGASKAKPKPPLFASGKIKVPVGKSKPLKMKLTAAGKKLLNSGKKIKVKLELKITRPGAKAQSATKTLTIQKP